MDGQFVDDLARDLAHGPSRRGLLARVAGIGIGGLLAAAGVPRPTAAKPKPAAAKGKPVGARCQHHKQCASRLCEVTSGTCVAQCTGWDEACGDGCLCMSVGVTGLGACLQLPEDLNCAGLWCTWDVDAADPFDVLTCPDQPGAICNVSGTCNGPEEACLPLCPPSRLG